MRMLSGWRFFIAIVSCNLLLIWGCNSSGEDDGKKPDTFNSGTIHISCDESFKPAIDAQVEVFQYQNPDAKIIVHYKPEAECLKDFLVDTIRMVIATRGFSKGEAQLISDSLLLGPEQVTVARDLVAVILNPAARDTNFTMQQIRDLLSGKDSLRGIPVFDGKTATSTVRYIIDSVLKGGNLSPNVQAANSSREVVEFVARNPKAIGFVGFSWVGNQDDSSQTQMAGQVKLASVERKDSAGKFIKPSQYFIYTGQYPMVRDLVYVLKEKHDGLGSAFGRFLEDNDKGQLIFRRSYLMPVRWPNYIRDAELK